MYLKQIRWERRVGGETHRFRAAVRPHSEPLLCQVLICKRRVMTGRPPRAARVRGALLVGQRVWRPASGSALCVLLAGVSCACRAFGLPDAGQLSRVMTLRFLPNFKFENGKIHGENNTVISPYSPVVTVLPLLPFLPTVCSVVKPFESELQTPRHFAPRKSQDISLSLRTVSSITAITLSILRIVQSLSPVRLCDPMDCSTPGLPVHHHLPELAQTHVHRVRDAIQPSCPLSSPSLPAFSLSRHQGLFQ